MQNWLVEGVSQNWETALTQPIPIWGLKPRYRAEFSAMNIGDLLWFYVTKDVKGVIGLGMVKDKYIDEINLVWVEELMKKEVVWPLRFRIQVLKVIGKDYWKTDNIKINDFGLNWQVGFQLLQDEHVATLSGRAQLVFGFATQKELFEGATIPEPMKIAETVTPYTKPADEVTLTHRGLQGALAEIGKLQSYYTQTEYSIELPGEGKNIDVVWKREIAGMPTFAFEVELSGMIEKAIARLKFAFIKWNSNPRIVVPEKFLKKVNNLIVTEGASFTQQFQIMKPKQITELLNKKRDYKTLEQNLGIY